MAIYHCSVKILSRSAGRSSVQFAAYMSGSEMHDDRINETFTHTSKDEVCYSDMLFSERIPQEMRDAEKFWNNVEANEKQSNSQIARTFELALPHELTIEQNIELTKNFAKSLLDDGIPAAQIAVHKKDGNWHAHIMVPTRDFKDNKWQAKEKKVYTLDENGNKIPILDEHGNQKYRERKGKGKEWIWERKTVLSNTWNQKSMLKNWRKRFADMQNKSLEKYGHSERVDDRSYAEQGVGILPCIHEGYNARKIEKQGGISERCEYNRNIIEQNKLLKAITDEIKKLTNEINTKRDELNERIKSLLNGNRTTNTVRTASSTARNEEYRNRTAADYDQTAAILQRQAQLRIAAAGRADRDAARERQVAEAERRRTEAAAERERLLEKQRKETAERIAAAERRAAEQSNNNSTTKKKGRGYGYGE